MYVTAAIASRQVAALSNVVDVSKARPLADTLFPSTATRGRAMHFFRNFLDVIGVGRAA